jgi:ADP-ribose pyrophosphatase YjhB (NUDIX family)
MRRSRPVRLVDAPRLAIRVILEVAALFGGRYRRTEGAHILAVDDAGRILVVRTWYLGPGWSLPGGRVERGETPHAAAARETREETGLDVTVNSLVLVDAHRSRDTSFVFTGTVTGGDLAPQLGEIAEVGWLDREEVARTSHRLDRLLRLIPESGVAYIGLRPPRIGE